MKFDYICDKKNHMKILRTIYRDTIYIYLMIFYLITLFLQIEFLKREPLLFLIISIITIIILYFIFNYLLIYLVIIISNKKLGTQYGPYTCVIDDNKIIDGNNNGQIEIKFNDIKKIKYIKDNILIYSKSKPLFLFFNKQVIGVTIFDSLKKKVEENTNNWYNRKR